MQTLPICHTDRIWGFQARPVKTVARAEIKVITGKNHSVHDDDFHVRCAIVKLTRLHHECKRGSRDVAACFRRTRHVQGESIGELQTFCELDVHMLTCRTRGKSRHESFSFLPHPQARITKAFARIPLKFRESMSITDVARDFGVDWRCVKDVEREYLAEKRKVVSPKGVEAITIDETCLFPRERSNRKYAMIVRDAKTNRVPGVTRISAEPQASFA